MAKITTTWHRSCYRRLSKNLLIAGFLKSCSRRLFSLGNCVIMNAYILHGVAVMKRSLKYASTSLHIIMRKDLIRLEGRDNG